MSIFGDYISTLVKLFGFMFHLIYDFDTDYFILSGVL